MPKNIDKTIQYFIKQIKSLLGDRVKKNNIVWFICKRRL